MKERDGRLEAEPDELLHEAAVAFQRREVELPAPGLDTAPRDREPEGIRPGLAGERCIPLVARPGLHGLSARLSLRSSRRLPVRPVTRVASLHLVVRNGDAPEPGSVAKREEPHRVSGAGPWRTARGWKAPLSRSGSGSAILPARPGRARAPSHRGGHRRGTG